MDIPNCCKCRQPMAYMDEDSEVVRYVCMCTPLGLWTALCAKRPGDIVIGKVLK